MFPTTPRCPVRLGRAREHGVGSVSRAAGMVRGTQVRLSRLEACNGKVCGQGQALSSWSFPVLFGRVPAPSGPSRLLKGCGLGKRPSRTCSVHIDPRPGHLPDRDWLRGCGVTERSLWPHRAGTVLRRDEVRASSGSWEHLAARQTSLCFCWI